MIDDIRDDVGWARLSRRRLPGLSAAVGLAGALGPLQQAGRIEQTTDRADI
jgi:hypothetical protein